MKEQCVFSISSSACEVVFRHSSPHQECDHIHDEGQSKPILWSFSSVAKEYYSLQMYSHFPELWLCNNHWKATQITFGNYPDILRKWSVIDWLKFIHNIPILILSIPLPVVVTCWILLSFEWCQLVDIGWVLLVMQQSWWSPFLSNIGCQGIVISWGSREECCWNKVLSDWCQVRNVIVSQNLSTDVQCTQQGIEMHAFVGLDGSIAVTNE